MVDWFRQTDLVLLAVALIFADGLMLVCWGLFGDRSKGRPRCPKCWYDMRGSLPRLECPECGHQARYERRLYKNRRGRRPIAIGAVLVLLCCYPFAVVGGWYREQLIIRQLTNRGHWADSATRTGPEWLVNRLRPRFARFFDRVRLVALSASGTDADLAMCGTLRHLTELQASESQVTDAGLVHLAQLAHLREVNLRATRVTGAGLIHLQATSMHGRQSSADSDHNSDLRRHPKLLLLHAGAADARHDPFRYLTSPEPLLVIGTEVHRPPLSLFMQISYTSRFIHLPAGVHLDLSQVTETDPSRLKGLSQSWILLVSHVYWPVPESLRVRVPSELEIADLPDAQAASAAKDRATWRLLRDIERRLNEVTDRADTHR